MIKIVVSFTFITLLSACADTYISPSSPLPRLWTGDSGVEATPNTLHIIDGVIKVGDTLLEHELEFKRTALLSKPIEFKSAFGKKITLNAGKIFFAEDYVTYRSGTRNTVENFAYSKDNVNPIEWCTIIDTTNKHGKTKEYFYCAFWESEHKARYINGYLGKGGYLYEPTHMNSRGTSGPVPDLIEQPVDFPVKIKMTLKVKEITKLGVRVQPILSHDSRTLEKSEQILRWKMNRTKLKYEGFYFDATPSDDYRSVVTKTSKAQ